MDRQAELAIIRRAYARQITASVGVKSAAIENAFAEVKREDFLSPGPWQMLRHLKHYISTPDDDPVYLYTDDLVAIDAERQINNGQPSLHAYLLNAAEPKPGEHVVHVGTGGGYYTAIMAKLVGASGRVTGVEHDPQLARRAAANLSAHANVKIIEGDGAAVSYGKADVIYVNAGATAPAAAWLDRLLDGGRLILPLTTQKGFGAIEPTKIALRGAVFRIERRGGEYLAKWLSPVAIFPCAGNRDDVSETALAQALEKGGAQRVTRLYREAVPETRCWLRGQGWCLGFE